VSRYISPERKTTGLVKWAEEYLDFYLYPLLLVFLVAYDFHRLLDQTWFWVLMFLAGWMAWNVAEYIIHRWVLHGPYWMGIHQRHHEHPRELTRFPLWQIPMYFVVIYGAVWACSGPWTVPVYAGVILGWIQFFALHHALHHYGHLRVFQGFAIRHNAHHKMTTVNYGIGVDWFDRLLGTYRAPKR
jgi:sterol desaturase/sphingolipid hydroxylase (fatty acid hydroxylase superfamily)